MYLQVWRLLFPALKENKKNSFLVVAGVLIMIALDVGFNSWRGLYYNALQIYDSKSVFLYLGLFCLLAIAYVLVYGFTSYFQRYLEFGVREHLFDKFSATWKSSNVSNPEQRLSSDGIIFGQLSLSLLKAIITATVKLPVFLCILYTVASWWVASILFLYAIGGTILSQIVSRKLINLEYLQETKEAEFRKLITYAVDKNSTFPTLDDIKTNWKLLATQNKYLSFFTSGYDQAGVIFPYILLLPLYLSKKILLGSLFQVAGAAREVLDSLSILVNSRDIIVQLSMVTRRLTEMEDK